MEMLTYLMVFALQTRCFEPKEGKDDSEDEFDWFFSSAYYESANFVVCQ